MRFIKEADVASLLALPAAIQCIERAFLDRAAGLAVDVPRERTKTRDGSLNVLQAASSALDIIGFKAYFRGRSAGTSLLQLINLKKGNLEAIIEAGELGMRRTSAATAVATRALAREDASTVACFGSGHHALAQLGAVMAVRPIRTVRVHGRTPEHLQAFRAKAEAAFGVPVTIAQSPEQALDGADIINLMTRSNTPLFDGSLLARGQHVNAVGSNALDRREIDLATIRACDVIVVDSIEVAQRECGDLLPAIESGLIHWHNIPDLGGVLAKRVAGRTTVDQITLFESHGMGIQDIYVGKYVLDAARQAEAGIDLPI